MLVNSESVDDGFEDPPLFLPLSPKTASRLAAGLPPAFEELQVAELAAILLVQAVATRGFATTSVAEHFLSELIAVGGDAAVNDGNAFAEIVRQRFDLQAFNNGMARLESLSIHLLEDAEIERGDYLLPNGRWDDKFCRRRAQEKPSYHRTVTPQGTQLRLSDPQFRLFEEFRAGLEESAHVQGYAGTGKTFLIQALVELLDPSRTLLLALSPAQVEALRQRVNDPRVRAMTFAALATEICESDLTVPVGLRRPGPRGRLSYRVTHEEVAALLGLQPVGNLAPTTVASMCQRAVSSFCASGDPVLTEDHLPRQWTPLSAADARGLVAYAQEFWKETLEPRRPGKALPLRGYHRIKYVVMSRRVVPERFTHVVVDESHDLSRPLIELLNASPQSVLTLGDEYQRLQGRVQPQAPRIRHRNIVRSVRAGRQMEDVLNPLISAHPGETKVPFEGARERQTRIVYYDRSEAPSRPTMIVVHSEWGLFEWFQRLSHANAKFGVLPASLESLKVFVQDCCELKRFGTRPRHGVLFRYASWESLAGALSWNKTFGMIERLLEKGYTAEDFLMAVGRLEPAAPTQLGLLSDVRNQEFDSVMLGMDFLAPFQRDNVDESARIFAAIYTGVSRPRHELIVPGELRGWVEDNAALPAAPPLKVEPA